ncbi:MAG: type II secretion system protein [Bacilli bacterium]|nr:type II secretion system protein [Bacilli bacterium]
MKKNQKGFSLIELVAAVAILSILTGAAVIGYSKYASSAKKTAIDMLRKSSENAMSEYLMDHAFLTEAKLSTLYGEGYLEKPVSPYKSSDVCIGKVTLENEEADVLEEPKYTVILCCSGHYFTYSSGSNTPVENDTCTVAE